VALMAKEMNKAKTGANVVATVGLILIGLVFFNLIANRFFTRLDFTADKIYTLSQPSRELVAKLPDRMTVKAYISDDLQPPFSQTAQFVRDLLSEYATASKGKFVWEAVDPGKDPKVEEEATKNKVSKTRRGRVSSNKVEIGASYLGVALQYQGNIESIPEINGAEGLEFELTRLIKMMTVKKKKIAFATGEGELSTQGDPQTGHGGLQIVGQYMKDYEVTQVNLAGTDKPLADDVDALVIAGPKSPFSDKAKFAIDQFLMRGRSVALLVDGMVVEAPRQMQMPGAENQPRIGRKNDVGLEDLLENYGLKIKDDLVLEPRQNVPGPVPVAGQMFLANYPTFVAATKMAPKISITDHVNAVVMPFCSSVEQVKDKQPNVTYTQLVTSTENAWRQTGFFLFDPQNAQLKVGDDKGPFPLAWSATGRFKSLYAGKSAPVAGDKRDESESTARLIVVGDSDFAADDYLRFGRQIPAYGSNLLLFMNMMDYLASDDTLAPLRAKGVQSRPITVGKESTPALVKYGNVVGVPLLFILFGVMRWRMRTARRRSAQL
jgi:ABC-type uncharacterized transport system involved in gliding motility auxiliary subunit